MLAYQFSAYREGPDLCAELLDTAPASFAAWIHGGSANLDQPGVAHKVVRCELVVCCLSLLCRANIRDAASQARALASDSS